MSKKTHQVEDTVLPQNEDVADLKKKPAAKKPAAKKAPAKKKAPASGSKTAKPKAKSTKTGKVSKSGEKVRYFKRIDQKTLESHGRYTGVTPKQAASKGFTKMVQQYKKKGRAVPPNLTIFLRESTRGSSGKVYGYTAERQKLDSPQELVIADKVTGQDKKITYEYRNKIRKGEIPEQIGGMKKKKPASKDKKPKAKKPKTKPSGSKTAKPKKAATKKPAAKKPAAKKPAAKKTTKK